MEGRKTIMLRIYITYFIVFAIAGLIVARIIYIQLALGEHYREMSKELTLQYITIEASKGSIYDAGGRLLATSIPVFDIRMDAASTLIDDETFNSNIDGLSSGLSQIFRDRNKQAYKQSITRARQNGNRYYLIKRNITYSQLKQLRKLPIFNRGRYKGGMIVQEKNKREKPFKTLASRTIGFSRDNYHVGIEGAYDTELGGYSGRRLMQRIANGAWIPVNDDNEIDPKEGNDIITTIDINLQDLAESSLKQHLIKHEAHHGCAVLMEVSTGEIKAIANLKRTSEGIYAEAYNYAIGEATEPGSTFKLASLMVAMEDGYIKPTDSVDAENGKKKYSNQLMLDVHTGEYNYLSVQESFEISSNVAVSKLIHQNYKKNPQKFIDGLLRMHLGQPLGIKIKGEGKSMIRGPQDTMWSHVSLPWISVGYEVLLTPLSILTFYNAVANGGIMVKPMFVKEIRHGGRVVKQFEPNEIKGRICSEETLENARRMLEGVVENGTARRLKNPVYSIAGKTGTAQIANNSKGYDKTNYQASFVGYFPANDPKYSCIVVVSNPAQGKYYGSSVAAPVFKDIADRVYATYLEMQYKPEPDNYLTRVPVSKGGYKKDIYQLYNELSLKYNDETGDNEWSIILPEADSVRLGARIIRDGQVPNLAGMNIRDAVYIMESLGYKVNIKGRGYVVKQYPGPGSTVVKGSKAILELSQS